MRRRKIKKENNLLNLRKRRRLDMNGGGFNKEVLFVSGTWLSR